MPSVPMALVCSDFGEAVNFIRQLSPNPRILDKLSDFDEMRENLINSRSDGVFLLMSDIHRVKTAKMEKLIDTVFSATTLGKIAEMPLFAATFLVFQMAVPEEYRDRVYEIRLDGAICEENFGILELVPESGQLSLVRDKINDVVTEKDSSSILKAATAFMYPKLVEKGIKSMYEELQCCCTEIAKLEQMYRDEDGIVDLVIQRFFEYVDEASELKIYSPPLLKEVEFETGFFIKDNALYLHEKLFRKIIEPLVEIIPIGLIKAALVKAGILIGDGNGYTTKMTYYSEGKLQRQRMMRFCTQQMQLDEKTNFKDYLKLMQY